MMRIFNRAAAIAMLIACSGCGKADISDARRDHILAGDHGWIDFSLDASPALAAPGLASCSIALHANGESILLESADIGAAVAAHSPVGYRFPSAVGTLQIELNISGCTKTPVVVRQALVLEKDTLRRLHFDGKAVKIDAASPYQPTTLDWVRGELGTLHAVQITEEKSMASLKEIAMASLVLNVLLVLLLLKRR